MLSRGIKLSWEAKKKSFQKSELLPYVQVESETAETRTAPLSILSLFVTRF